jgi:hypothetical protein
MLPRASMRIGVLSAVHYSLQAEKTIQTSIA